MKKLAIGLCALVLLVIIGLRTAPLFLNPNDFKQIIQTKFNERTGLELSSTSEISLSLFPTPRAEIDEVSVSNSSRVLVSIKNITAYPKFGDLFSGNFVVDALDINEPKLVVEKAGGQFSWQQTDSAAADNAKIMDAAQSATGLSIKSIKINKGYFEYRDKDKEKNYIAKDLQGSASLASLDGPLDFSANATFMDEKVSFKGGIKNLTSPEIALETNFMGSDLSWNGTKDKAKLAIITKDIGPITKKFELKDIDYMAGKPISLSADVTKTEGNIELQNISAQVAQSQGGGKILIMPSEDTIDVSADLKFKNLDLKDVIPSNSEPVKIDAEVVDKKAFRESINAKKITANLIFAADTIVYGKSAIDDVELQASYDDGNILISPLTASMSGTGRFEISGVMNKDSKGRAFDGTVTATSTDIRKVLTRLGVDSGGIKEEKLKDFVLSSDMYARITKGAKLNFSKTEVMVDESQFSGNLGVIVKDDVNVDISGEIGQIDLDKYIIKKVEPKEITLEQKKQKNLEKKLDFTWLQNMPLNGKTNLSIGSITLEGKNYANVLIKSEFKPKKIDFSNLSAAASEIQFSARGGIDVGYSRPKISIEANLSALNTLDFIKHQNTENTNGELLNRLPSNESRWSKEPFDFAPLDEVDIDFVINSPLVNHKGLMLNDLFIKGFLASSKIDIDKFNAGVYGGELNLKGRFGIGAVPSADINFTARDFDLNSMAKGLVDNDRVAQGKMTVTGSLSTSGVHQRAMAEGLEGSLTIAGRDIWIKGFDLDGFANQITNINGPEALVPVAKTLTGDTNTTRINSVSGVLLCGQGVMKPQNFQVSTNSGNGVYAGYVDLVKWHTDTNVMFKLVIAGTKERLGLGIRIFGSISEPKQEQDFDELIAYFSKHTSGTR